MSTFCLELRSTQNWNDVRYRSYTKSESVAERFRSVPKITFTDSGHGIVPTVSEGRRGEPVSVLKEHVEAHMSASAPARKSLTAQWRDLALQFDAHRIEALAMLRAAADGAVTADDIRAFLAKPPPLPPRQ